MSGKKRFAAIFATLTSLAGTGGGTAYYLTQVSQMPWPIGATVAGEPENATTAHDSTLAASDLSAVESAWVEAANDSGEAAETVDRPTVARSAKDSLADLDTSRGAIVEPAKGDRYDIASDVEPVSDEVVHDDTTSAKSGIVAEPATADGRYAALTNDVREPEVATNTEEAQALAEVTVEASEPIARGQEPGDEPNVLPLESSQEPSDANANALRSTTSSPASGSAVRRAREAFQEQSQTLENGRYRAAGSAPGALNSEAGASAQAINPFGAGPATAPSGAGPGEPSAIEPVAEAANADGAVGSGAIEPLGAAASGAPRAPEENPYREAPADYGRGDARSASLPPSPNTYGASQPAFSDAGGAMPGGEGTGRPGERALEGPQNPALVMQKVAPPEIQVGKKAKFLIKVQNVGNQTAEEVVIRDEVPQGTRLEGTSPTAEVSGTQLTWNIGKLSTGEERTVEVELMPTTEGEVGSVATVSYSGQASAKSRCTMPQLAIRMSAPKEVMIGQEQRVKIELHNPGSGDAMNVMLFENVPDNVKHAAGPALEFEIGSLKAGETRELELILLAEKAGKVVNVLSARAEGNLQVQQQVEFEVIAPAISVAVDGPGRRYLERPATYQVIVENPGTAPARDIELVTKLPKGLQFIKANNMGEYDASTHAVYWSLAELPEGESGTVELTAMPIETGSQTLSVEGRAQQGLTDETTQQIEIEGLASIMFEVKDEEDPIEIGGETSYEIRVVNEGTKAATNVQVMVGLTPGMQVLSAEGETRHSVQGADVSFEPLAQLAPKADTVYHVKVKGLQAGDQRINVEVKTDDLSQPIRREESTRVFGDE